MYSSDIKTSALNLLIQGKKVTDVSSETRISKSTLYSWRKTLLKNQSEPFPEFKERNKIIRDKIALIESLIKTEPTRAETLIAETKILIKEIRDECPQNPYTLSHATKLAKIERDVTTVIMLLKERLSFEPDNEIAIAELKKFKIKKRIQSARHLIETFCTEHDDATDINNPLLLEAQRLLTEALVFNPNNLYVISYLIKVARYRGLINDELRLLRLKTTLDPNNRDSLEELKKLSIKIKNNQNEKKYVVFSSNFLVLHKKLLSALDENNISEVTQILTLMLDDKNLIPDLRKKINKIIDLTRSKKTNNIIALRGQILNLKRKEAVLYHVK